MEYEKDRTNEPFSVLMIGATGATGREVVKELLELPNLTKMTLLQRKINNEVIPSHDKIHQIEVNFDKLGFEFESKKIEGHTFAMSFLGTTKSAAGGAERYRQVEVDYPRDFARMAKQVGCEHAVLMSSDGANSGSMVTYLSQKGQVEEEWKKLDFATLTILRPGVLDRGELKNTMEKIMGWMMKPMPCTTIGRAVRNRVQDIMLEDTKEVKETVWRNKEITDYSERKEKAHLSVTSMGVDVQS